MLKTAILITGLVLASTPIALAQTAPQSDASFTGATELEGLEPRTVESDFRQESVTQVDPVGGNATVVPLVEPLEYRINRTYPLEELGDDATLATQSQEYRPLILENEPLLRGDNLQLQIQTPIQ